jgi:hypothetical protein
LTENNGNWTILPARVDLPEDALLGDSVLLVNTLLSDLSDEKFSRLRSEVDAAGCAAVAVAALIRRRNLAEEIADGCAGNTMP